MKKFKAGNVISHIYLIILTLISIFCLLYTSDAADEL